MAYGLGRLLEHDPRSRNFPAQAEAPIADRLVWRNYGPILDQGELGACTGFALAQCLMTGPLRRRSVHMTNHQAIEIYSLGTQRDDYPGGYPPDDTGSSGLGVCKAAQELGLITRYEHAFGVEHARAALAVGPVIVGTNWYESMFEPTADGQLLVQGEIAGGHEYLCLGYDDDRWLFLNSWSNRWGMPLPRQLGDVSGGAFWLEEPDVARLLDEDGDVTQPLL